MVTPSKFRAVLIAVSFLLAVAACGSDDSTSTDETSTAETSSTDPSSEVALAATSTVGGGQIDWNSIEGQDTVLWFWAPW